MGSHQVSCRRQWSLRGVVQGVGFRPHVARVASHHAVTGLVGNDDQQVFVEAQGLPEVLDAFIGELTSTLPPLAHLVSVSCQDRDPVDGEQGFQIVASRRVEGQRSLVPPDTAVCPKCLEEMRDPGNRRHQHPFITCTGCGPRLSIIEDLPYDRPATTMSSFAMCEQCRREYTDPADRRFHAQPVSCWECGPALWLVEAGQDAPLQAPDRGRQAQLEVVAQARARLGQGQVLAVKGVGGYHLMCDARNEAAVARLRERKRKSQKPFAVMARDLGTARSLVRLSALQEELLTSPARPILVAPVADGQHQPLAPGVAPGLDDLGVLLPYAPLHHLLLEERQDGADLDVLVATSGNSSAEPLCHRDAEALARLAHLADAFIMHDRGIHVPVEDSVLLTHGETVLPVRRARGYAPLPLVLPSAGGGEGEPPVVLGVGGEYKNTFTLAETDLAFTSAHLGDMGSWESQQAFETSVEQLTAIHRRAPQVVVHDLHPDYATTAWARRWAQDHPEAEVLGVQHHWAHSLSLLAEHGLSHGPVVVAAVDGTGYGLPEPRATDGSGTRVGYAPAPGASGVWGGEVLTLGPDLTQWERVWHVPWFPLAGADRAVRRPWRTALGLAWAWGLDVTKTPAWRQAPAQERAVVLSQLEAGVAVVATSSLGRVFDACSALLGVCLQATYEAQAAMELEHLARREAPTGVRPQGLEELVAEVVGSQASTAERARMVHDGIAHVLTEQIAQAAQAAGAGTVGISGGAAMNRLLLGAVRSGLEQRGLELLTHQQVPPNDGGLSLGQAFAGRLLARK